MSSDPEAADWTLPTEFLERLARILGDVRSDVIEQSFFEPKAAAFRVNRLLAAPDETCRELLGDGLSLEPLGWLPDGFFVPADQRSMLTRHRLVDLGHIYIHNPSSMLAALVLAPQPGETVMDLAAAPGGKTLHLAALMGEVGFLSAVEPILARFYKLKENLRRGGAAFVRTYQLDGRRVPAKTGPRFDRVLLDAPCSGEARFHVSDPDSFRNWSLRKIRQCRSKQSGLIQAGFASLKPGGRMLYCTCSFAPEENEAVVASLVQEQRSCHLLEIELPIENWQAGLTAWEGLTFPESVRLCRRVLPNDLHDALFLALIEKSPE
ncbi:MAG: RsmB/NOP family class I SAM-dependent RNA methyltransferase [Pirellulaceae bacterium]|nr:RsmB/NOP family class I SAM-dependent RNA methyltransferase [Pirellulaceae bacterium]